VESKSVFLINEIAEHKVSICTEVYLYILKYYTSSGCPDQLLWQAKSAPDVYFWICVSLTM